MAQPNIPYLSNARNSICLPDEVGMRARENTSLLYMFPSNGVAEDDVTLQANITVYEQHGLRVATTDAHLDDHMGNFVVVLPIGHQRIDPPNGGWVNVTREELHDSINLQDWSFLLHKTARTARMPHDYSSTFEQFRSFVLSAKRYADAFLSSHKFPTARLSTSIRGALPQLRAAARVVAGVELPQRPTGGQKSQSAQNFPSAAHSSHQSTSSSGNPSVRNGNHKAKAAKEPETSEPPPAKRSRQDPSTLLRDVSEPASEASVPTAPSSPRSVYNDGDAWVQAEDQYMEDGTMVDARKAMEALGRLDEDVPPAVGLNNAQAAQGVIGPLAMVLYRGPQAIAQDPGYGPLAMVIWRQPGDERAGDLAEAPALEEENEEEEEEEILEIPREQEEDEDDEGPGQGPYEDRQWYAVSFIRPDGRVLHIQFRIAEQDEEA